MNIIKRFDQYDSNCIYFCEPIKNNIMNESTFIRLLYSTEKFVLNGIYLLIQLTFIDTEKYYNKHKCIFDVDRHIETTENIKRIENEILYKIGIKNKTPQYKITEQFKNGNIKIFSYNIPKNNTSFILKISGIWETNTSYGLTYKFTKID